MVVQVTLADPELEADPRGEQPAVVFLRREPPHHLILIRLQMMLSQIQGDNFGR